MAIHIPVPHPPVSGQNLLSHTQIPSIKHRALTSNPTRHINKSVSSAAKIQGPSKSSDLIGKNKLLPPPPSIPKLPASFLATLRQNPPHSPSIQSSSIPVPYKPTKPSTSSQKPIDCSNAPSQKKMSKGRKRKRSHQNPCTNKSGHRRRSRAERYNEIRRRKVISSVNPKQTKYKCPNQTASEFHAVYKMLNRVKSSKMTSDSGLPLIMNMNEQIELFGRKVAVRRSHGNGQRRSSRSNQSNAAVPVHQSKKQKISHTVCEIKCIVSEEQLKRENEKETRLDYAAYCKWKRIELQQNPVPDHDPNDSIDSLDDFEWIKQQRIRKARERRNGINGIKKEDEEKRIIRTPSKKNQLFTSIMTKNSDGHLNDIRNWRFLEKGLPSTECIDCGASLLVIPKKHIGEVLTPDSTTKSGTYGCGLYKIAVLCPKYPDCKFPLYRPTYSKYWTVSGWYDDRRRNQSGDSKIKSKSASSKRELDRSEEEIAIISNEPSSKRRKLTKSTDSSSSNLSNSLNGTQPEQEPVPVRKRINSYQYLQSLSSTTSRSNSCKPRLNEKNLKRLLRSNQRRNSKAVLSMIDDSRSDVTASTTSLLSRTSSKSTHSTASRSSGSTSSSVVEAGSNKNRKKNVNVVLK